jgi:hypothetical protein
MTNRFPDDPQSLLELAKRLEHLLDLSRDDQPNDPGGWNLVHSLASIDESCRRLTEVQLPSLRDSSDPEELTRLLAEIGVELQHLAHHIADARHYGYLGVTVPSATEDPASDERQRPPLMPRPEHG